MNSTASSVSKVVYIFLTSVFSNYFYIDNFIRYRCLCYKDNWTCNDGGGADAKLQLNILKLDKAIIGL